LPEVSEANQSPGNGPPRRAPDLSDSLRPLRQCELIGSHYRVCLRLSRKSHGRMIGRFRGD